MGAYAHSVGRGVHGVGGHVHGVGAPAHGVEPAWQKVVTCWRSVRGGRATYRDAHFRCVPTVGSVARQKQRVAPARRLVRSAKREGKLRFVRAEL